jgi:hypothetical protein
MWDSDSLSLRERAGVRGLLVPTQKGMILMK